LYQIGLQQVTDFTIFEPGCGFKATIVRPKVSGHIGVGDADIFGSNQHVPLLDVPIPWEET
jgi:hypothetical protein